MLGKTDFVSVSSWNNMVDDTWGYTRRVAIRPNKPSAFVVELPVSVVAWHFPDRTECRRFFQSAQPKNFPCPALLKRGVPFAAGEQPDARIGITPARTYKDIAPADGSTRRHLPTPVQACWVECA
jgi:hypothetical protein